MTQNRFLGFGAALLILASVLVPAVRAQTPLMWGEDGIMIRQGHHIEWQRNTYRRSDGYVLVVWSDTRLGNRDVYAQLIRPDGTQAWESTGKPVVTYPYRQEDPDICAVNGGWVIGWIEFRHDSTGDVYAQKLDDAGNRLWGLHGAVVDTFVREQNCFVAEYSLRVAHDGRGGAIFAWEDGRRGDLGDIYAQRLDSLGNRAWAQPLAVTNIEGNQIGITADADGQGNMLVAWVDTRISSDQNIYAAKITAAGQLPWGANGRAVCTAPGRQSGAKLCPDGQGGCFIAWVDQRTGSSDDIYIQRLDASGQPQFAANGIPLCNAPENQAEVRVAISMNGGTADGCVAAWTDVRVNGFTSEVYVQKVLHNGNMVWTANGVKVCGDASTDPSNPGNSRDGVRLTSDLAGGLVCAWEDTRATGDWLRCDLYAGRVLASGSLSWTGQCGVLVADGANQQFQPVLRMDAGSGVFIIYDDMRSGSQSVRYQRLSLATGERTLAPDGAEIVAGLDGDAVSPLTVAMANRRVGVVWSDARYGAGTALFFQVLDDSGRIAKPMNGAPLVTDNEGYPTPSQANHQVCADGNGGFYVAFEDLRTGARHARVIRVGADGDVATNPAGSLVWSDANTRDQTNIRLAADWQGGCYVAWSSYNPNDYLDVFVMRMNSAGERVWAQPVRLTSTDVDDVVRAITSNPDGCAIIAWTSGGFEASNISAARVCGDGTVTWNFDVCNALNIQDYPDVVADGFGGAYFAWQDNRNPIRNEDIYAQHVQANGTESWTRNGIPVISDTLVQKNVRLTVDAQRNLTVVWEDYRAEQLDLYAQKLTPAGTRLWPAAGKRICTAPGDQFDAALHTERYGGVYMAWTDGRGLFPDIMGTHLDTLGNPAHVYWQAESGGPFCAYYQEQSDVSIADDGWGGVTAAWVDLRASGKEPLKNIWAQRVNDGTVGRVREIPDGLLPARHELAQNYPNPFNPVTQIRFALPRAERVEIAVFNLLGQRVATLVDRDMAAGKYEITFDARALPSGMYFYRMKTASFADVKKMALVR